MHRLYKHWDSWDTQKQFFGCSSCACIIYQYWTSRGQCRVIARASNNGLALVKQLKMGSTAAALQEKVLSRVGEASQRAGAQQGGE